MPALFEVLDSSQPVEHALQASTLGHDTCHLIHFFLILLFIYRTDTDCEERKQAQYGKLNARDETVKQKWGVQQDKFTSKSSHFNCIKSGKNYEQEYEEGPGRMVPVPCKCSHSKSRFKSLLQSTLGEAGKRSKSNVNQL